MSRGLVLDRQGMRMDATTRYRAGEEIRYWREVPEERRIDAVEAVLYADEHLVVADKPHGLPVMPAGNAVGETLLARLAGRLGNPHLVPLHRIDRDTAGLVLFSARRDSRAAYHALFREQRIEKSYEALAAPLPDIEFPLVRRTRIEPGDPFFRMREVEGEANAETRITVLERGDHVWRYSLLPVTGRKHQLRVQMAGLGAPIRNDRCYPVLRDACGAPLQLLAKSLSFADALSGNHHSFHSRLALMDATPVRPEFDRDTG